MARRSGFQKTISAKGWSTSLCGLITGLDIGAAAAAIGSVTAISQKDQTILRTRGQVYAQLDSGAVDERVMVAVGIAVVSDPAALAGVGAIPTPDTEGSYDWLWHGFLSVSSGAEGAVVNDSQHDRLEIDSKAMRKIGSSDTLVFAAEICATVDQTGTVDLMYATRILFGD